MMIYEEKREYKGEEKEKRGEKGNFSLYLGENYHFGNRGRGKKDILGEYSPCFIFTK